MRSLCVRPDFTFYFVSDLASDRPRGDADLTLPRVRQAGGVVRTGDQPSPAQDVIDKQSQEYVDEKLAEFQAAIHHLQGGSPTGVALRPETNLRFPRNRL